jgi:hypothetical protein
MLLTLLILVAGLLGGPVDAADPALLVDTDRGSPARGAPIAAAPVKFSMDWVDVKLPATARGGIDSIGGTLNRPAGGGGVPGV